MNKNEPAADECPICFETYQLDRKAIKPPVVGSCGHSMCKKCAREDLQQNDFNCPTCRVKKSFKYSPVSFGMISALQEIRDLKQRLATRTEEPSRKRARNDGRKSPPETDDGAAPRRQSPIPVAPLPQQAPPQQQQQLVQLPFPPGFYGGQPVWPQYNAFPQMYPIQPMQQMQPMQPMVPMMFMDPNIYQINGNHHGLQNQQTYQIQHGQQHTQGQQDHPSQ